MNTAQFLAELGKYKGMSLREAMNRSEYANFMAKGVKGLLADAYAQAALQSTFQEIVTEDSSTADKEDYPSIGDPSMPEEVLEGEVYPNLQNGTQDNVAVTNKKFGGIITLSFEARDDDQSPGKSLSRQATALGRKAMERKDKAAYSILINSPTIYDGGAFFALNHPGYNGGAARGNNDNIYTGVTLSVNALATVMGIIAAWEGADPDQDLDIMPEKIVCPVTLSHTANGITRADLLPLAAGAGPLGPAMAGGGGVMPNGFKGKLAVVSSARLDKSSVVDWYVKAAFPGLLHLKRQALTVVQEAINSGKGFERDEVRWKVSERDRFKVINFRWGVKVS